MRKRTRTILFLFSVALFLILGPGVVLYAQGYRIDFFSGQLTRTGAIYVKVEPSNALVQIDEKSPKRTSVLSNALFTQSLLPGEYTIQIEKAGYHPWRKTMQVRAQETTEAKNIILFPLDPNFESIANNVADIWSSPNKEYIAYAVDDTEGQNLYIWNIEQQQERLLWQSPAEDYQIQELVWDADSERVAVRTAIGQEEEIFITGIDRSICPGSTCSFLGSQADELYFSPTAEDRIYFLNSQTQRIVEWNYRTNSTVATHGATVYDFTISNQDLYWIDQRGIIWRKNIGSQAVAEQHFSFNIAMEPGESAILRIVQGKALVLYERTLYLLEENMQEVVMQNVTDFSLDPAEKRIIIVAGSELWLYFMEPQLEQPHREKGDRVFLTRFSQAFRTFSWITSHYLALAVDEQIKVAETDTRDGSQIIDFANFASPKKIVWSSERDTMYVFSHNILYASDNLSQY